MRRSADGPSPVTPSLRDTLLLRERALQATTVSVVITDARLPDNPMVWANEEFSRTTGYSFSEIVGRNLRMLQGPETDPAAVAEMRESIEQGRPSMVTLVNYRADGSSFWNSVSTAPVFDEDGSVMGFIGMQVDVTDRVVAQREREQKLREEHAARLVAEKAQRTLSLLAEVNERLVSTFDLGKAMQSLAELLVPGFADGCAIDLVGEASAGSDRPERVAAASIAPGSDEEVGDPALLGRVLRTGRPVSVQDLADPQAQSLLVVPLKAHDGVVGALTLVSVGQTGSYDEEHLELALDIGRRAAQSIEWCRLYERERRVASMLQRSLLPELPRIPGLEAAARYRTADTGGQVGSQVGGRVGGQVGGDWYDLLPLPDGSVGIVVGDALGNDLDAAAAMGRIRSVLRSYAYELTDPAELIGRLDELARGLEASMTLWYGVLSADGKLRHANAGHPAPLLRHADGETTFLEVGRSGSLGSSISGPRSTNTDVVGDAGTLVLYTDGLVGARADVDPAAGLEQLRQLVADTDSAIEPPALCSHLLEHPTIAGLSAKRENVAILVVQRRSTST